MRAIKVDVWFLVLLWINCVVLGERWYCKKCHAIHVDVCPKPLLDESRYDFTDQQKSLLKKIKAGMEDLDAKSRGIAILQLMYLNSSEVLGVHFSPERNVIDWARLKIFSDSLWREIFVEEGNFGGQTAKRESSDLKGIAEVFEKLEAYLEDTSYEETFDRDEIKGRVENDAKIIVQKCCLADLSSIQEALKKYEGANFDIVRIMRAMESVLKSSCGETPEEVLNVQDNWKDVNVGAFEGIDFMQCILSVVQYPSDVVALLQGPAIDESDLKKILELIKSPCEAEYKIQEIQDNIEALLSYRATISIMDLIERLMERYAFSFGAITPCYFLAHWMNLECKSGLKPKSFAEKFE